MKLCESCGVYFDPRIKPFANKDICLHCQKRMTRGGLSLICFWLNLILLFVFIFLIHWSNFLIN